MRAIFGGHEGDTVDQIDRIEDIFAALDVEPREQGSPIMKGLLTEKDQFVAEVEDNDFRDLNAISIGMINEQLEITRSDQLLFLAESSGCRNPQQRTWRRTVLRHRRPLSRCSSSSKTAASRERD